MRFGTLPLDEAEGALLAHTLRLEGFALKKGTRLDADAIMRLRAAGVEAVQAARLEEGEVDENEAALKLALALAGPGLEVRDTRTGRVNLHAATAGLLRLDAARINALNGIDEALTIATLADGASLAPGDMAATCKVIPYAVPGDALARCLDLAAGGAVGGAAGAPILGLLPFRPLRARLIQTVLPGTSAKMLDKTIRITADRLAAVGGNLMGEGRVDHEEKAIVAAVQAARTEGFDLLLIAGAAAVQDRADAIPAAIAAAGGRILRFGMPVDPGNLLLLAEIDGTPIVGLPGCARSPKPNGFDWVLERLAAGLPVDGAAIAGMGVGGLLAEIPSRPQPREAMEAPDPAPPQIVVVLLAAGRSRRMGGPNKLLLDVDGEPLVRRTAQAALAAGLGEVIAVTGNAAEAVAAALKGLPVRLAHNPDYQDGLASSLKAGLRALPTGTDAAIVMLGDMPGVDADLLRALADAYDPPNGRRIVVPTHLGKRGNPVLWDRAFFPAMAALQGDVGARALIAQHPDAVAEVERPNDAPLLDLDTPEAWTAYLERGT
ncbi:MAG: molybdopterin-binding/glycosyltransferase family 2 protein [Geminicoccaceae bacterium]|nr:molybdopterin-binding/glycosyltransferase family 2 protein [Geminicoccaceae bacterium]